MSQPPTKAEIIEWCTNFVAKTLDIPRSRVNPTADFESFGLDSPAAVGLVVELEEWLQQEVSPSTLFEHPTIEKLAEYLAQRAAETAGEKQA